MSATATVPMRERFTYRGDSLWWFTELYLHKMRRLEDAIATILALESAIEQTAPGRLEVRCGSRAAALAARALGQARGLAITIEEDAPARRTLDAGLLVGVSALLSRLRPAPRPPAGPSRVAAFVHTAFWRAGSTGGDGRESYIGDVLDEVAARLPAADLRLVGVGPRRNFRTRRWWDPLVGRGARRVIPVEHYARRGQLTESLALWRQRGALATAVTSGDGIRAAGWHAGVRSVADPVGRARRRRAGAVDLVGPRHGRSARGPRRRSNPTWRSRTPRPGAGDGRSCSKRGGWASRRSACSTASSIVTG